MEDRWVIPLAVATMAGFLLGLLSAVLQLTGGSTFAVAAVGIAAGAAAAAASIFGSSDGWPLAARRALLAAGMFLGIYLAMLAFLRDGRPLVAFFWAVVAGVMAGLLRRTGDAPRGDASGGDAPGQPA